MARKPELGDIIHLEHIHIRIKLYINPYLSVWHLSPTLGLYFKKFWYFTLDSFFTLIKARKRLARITSIQTSFIISEYITYKSDTIQFNAVAIIKPHVKYYDTSECSNNELESTL